MKGRPGLAVSAKLRYEVLRRDKYTCRFCGATPAEAVLVIDHVMPRKLGGRDMAENLQVLCEDCNAGKSATMPERYLVAEVKKLQHDWERGGWPEQAEDDRDGSRAYMEAWEHLETCPPGQVLNCIAHVYAEVFPYRPYGTELIKAAAILARDGYGIFAEESA